MNQSQSKPLLEEFRIPQVMYLNRRGSALEKEEPELRSSQSLVNISRRTPSVSLSLNQKINSPGNVYTHSGIKLPELGNSNFRKRDQYSDHKPFGGGDQFSTVVIEKTERYTDEWSKSDR